MPTKKNDETMKTIAALLNNPLMVLLSSFVGATTMYYLQETAIQSLYWFIPCLAIIIADLAAGIKAAEFRGETIRVSGAARRTINKCVCYAAWIVCCVALNERYNTSMCAFVGMGIVFLIEGTSFVTNILEPHGLKVSIKGILRIVGEKHNIHGLENAIEKTDNATVSDKDSKEGDVHDRPTVH